MLKKELIVAIAEAARLDKNVVDKALDGLALVAQRSLGQGEDITLPGIGKLVLVQRAARVSRNPRTGESVNVPAKHAVKFKPSKDLEQAIN